MGRLRNARSGHGAVSVRETGRGASIQSVLQRCPVLQGASVFALEQMAQESTARRFMRNRNIYFQGDRGAFLYVIASGRVRVFRKVEDKRMFTVAYRGLGDLIGESAFASGQTYRDTAAAVDQVEVVQIPLESFERLITADPRLCIKLLRFVIERCLESERRLERIQSASITSRLADFLLEAAAKYGIPESRGAMIGSKYTHREIADYLGATRETVTLILGDLKRQGIIVIDHRQLVIVNQEALRDLTGVQAPKSR